MEIHVFGYVRIRARWIGPLRLAGCFATHFVGVRNVIAIRQQCFGIPFAAVGADLSCPRIYKHPRNGERKRIFNNVETHIWLWKYTFLIMQGYGHDESVPYAWRSGSWVFRGWMCIFCGVFVGYFVGVGWVFTECSQRVRYLYVTYSPYKSMVFVFWMLCYCKLVAMYFVVECEYFTK